MSKYIINCFNKLSKINKNIYGQSCGDQTRGIYGGLWVGDKSCIENQNGIRKDVLEALLKIKVPEISWPGIGNSGVYRWKNAIGAQTDRKNQINVFDNNQLEDNSFGTNEFMDLCDKLGSGAYLESNLGDGSLADAVDWISYIIEKDGPMADVRKKNGHSLPWNIESYEIGNARDEFESSIMSAYYAGTYRHAAKYVRLAANKSSENPAKIVISGATGDDCGRTDMLMRAFTDPPYGEGPVPGKINMDALSLYCSIYHEEKSTEKADDCWESLLKAAAKVEKLILRQDAVMSKFDPKKTTGMVLKEISGGLGKAPAMKDAILAAMLLNIFNKHSDRVTGFSTAQMINGGHSVILTEGSNMVLTPVYYVYDMFKDHQNADLLDSFIETNTRVSGKIQIKNLYESASENENGNILCTICNTDLRNAEFIDCEIYGTGITEINGLVLSGNPDDANTFENPEKVTLSSLTVEKTQKGFCCEIPAGSIVRIKIAKA